MNDTIIENSVNNRNSKKNLSKNIDVASFIRFTKQIKIPELFGSLPDPRQQSKVSYSLSSLALWAFAACIFRQGSKNALQTTLEQLSSEQQKGMQYFLGITGESLPHYSTVDSALSRVDYEEFNRILLEMFDQMNTRKVFYNHAATLIPENIYHIGADGCHLHTYSHPHSVDEHGHNNCPHCLPRKRHAGTEKEETYWVHIVVTFVFICESFKIPLYVYPLKAMQVDTEQSDEKLKQECELTAAHAVLTLIRARFPKLKITFLGDGLYANRPFIRFCKKLTFGYIIVRKEKSLTRLRNKCDELAQSDLYQKYYTHLETKRSEDVTIKKKVAWFNGSDLDDGLLTNVLRFEEEKLNSEGKIISQYKCEWLCSEKISKTHCFKLAKRGRMRWDQEDFHNTCKNRGFNIEHDMARTNPGLLFVWKLIAFIAFFVFEIFNLSKIAKAARGKRSLMKFAKDMLQELVDVAWNNIKELNILIKAKVQFRFDFCSG